MMGSRVLQPVLLSVFISVISSLPIHEPGIELGVGPLEQTFSPATPNAKPLESVDYVPTPFAKQTLGNGMYEVTLKALEPLDVAAEGTANGMKNAGETTFMVCQQFDVSTLEAAHITKFTPLISKQEGAPDDGTIVHHVDLFLCDDTVPNMYPRGGARCDSFPEVVGGGKFNMLKANQNLQTACREFIYAYDRGAGPTTFPKDYGVRIGKGTPFKYLVMQRHILVRKSAPVFHEHTGVKLTLTNKLRLHNLGIAGVLDYLLSIPAGKKSYTYNFTCPATSVQEMLEPAIYDKKGGIRPVALHLHMHDLGKRMWFEVIRDGKVAVTIGRDDKYTGYGPSQNFHTELGPFSDDQLIRSGDALRVHCDFNTSERTFPVSYGTDWGDEMCGPLFYYSPHDPNVKRTNAYACESQFGVEDK